MKFRRLHWADTLGLILAAMLIICGLASVFDPHPMVFSHAAGDLIGGPVAGVLEIATPSTVRFYGITALSLGVGLALFMWWALKTTDDGGNSN